MSKPLAFHGLCLSTQADAVSIDLTDAGLLAEPWEQVEIDEQATVPVVPCAPVSDALAGVRVVKPYRTLMRRFKLKHGLAA